MLSLYSASDWGVSCTDIYSEEMIFLVGQGFVKLQGMIEGLWSKVEVSV